MFAAPWLYIVVYRFDTREMTHIYIYIYDGIMNEIKLYWQALDLVPKKIHERSPIFLGSYDDVEEIKALYAAEEKKG